MTDSRKTGKLKWRWAGAIEPNFWEPGLIDGLVERGSMWIMYGASGSGKTAMAVDVAGAVALGLPWRDHDVQKGLVVYVAAENHFSTGYRIWAWRQQHKVPHGAAPADFPLLVTESKVLLGEGTVAELVGLVEEAAKEAGMPPVLVVLDTLARTMEGDENSTKDMNNYVHWADALKDATGATVLIIHHTGKIESRGARGSSALKAATDQEWEVFRGDDEAPGAARGVKMSKMREGSEEGRVYGFRLEQVVLGANKLGRPVTTVVAVIGDPPVRGAGKMAEFAELAVAYIRGQGGRATLVELKEAIGAISNGKPDAERKAWDRLAKKHLRALPGGYLGIPLELEDDGHDEGS